MLTSSTSDRGGGRGLNETRQARQLRYRRRSSVINIRFLLERQIIAVLGPGRTVGLSVPIPISQK